MVRLQTCVKACIRRGGLWSDGNEYRPRRAGAQQPWLDSPIHGATASTNASSRLAVVSVIMFLTQHGELFMTAMDNYCGSVSLFDLNDNDFKGNW
jgi:hypothetical protein